MNEGKGNAGRDYKDARINNLSELRFVGVVSAPACMLVPLHLGIGGWWLTLIPGVSGLVMFVDYLMHVGSKNSSNWKESSNTDSDRSKNSSEALELENTKDDDK